MFAGEIRALIDPREVPELPAAWGAILMIKPETGQVAAGAELRFGRWTETVLDVADNTAFFDAYEPGCVGVAIAARGLWPEAVVGRRAEAG